MRQLLVGATILAVLLSVGAHTGAVQSAPASPESLDAWRVGLSKTAHPSTGCFTAGYPTPAWRETGCVPAPSVPMLPNPGPAPLSVGGFQHYVAESPTGAPITVASGKFDSVSGVEKVYSPISESGELVLDAYSLQLNTNHFRTTVCADSPNPECKGWKQFLFTNNGTKGLVFIQYWLINYNKDPCPTGWTKQDSPFVEINCFRTTPGKVVAGNTPITRMATFVLEGDVSHPTDDKVTFWLGATPHSYSVPRVLDGRPEWTMAEFNVFGYGYGHEAKFNYDLVPDPEADPVASVLVRTNINYGGTQAPNCKVKGFTAESNNLNYVGARPSSGQNGPALRFWQSSLPGVKPDCIFGETIGDTHQLTFGGLKYDFQASGDFVEAQTEAFEVQTRKVSGAPRWPDASVNRSAATKMGNTTVAVCEGTRLMLDGRPVTLPPGGTATLPSGVKIQRSGDVYDIRDKSSNSLRVEAKGSYIDLRIGLGAWPAAVRGLQGDPYPDNPTFIESKGGVRFAMPTSHHNLYTEFGESWRLPQATSLLSACDTVAQGAPGGPFFAQNLSAQDRQRGENVCRSAGVTYAWLAECVLDVVVLGTPSAAAVYVGKPPPVYNSNPLLPVCPEPRPGPC